MPPEGAWPPQKFWLKHLNWLEKLVSHKRRGMGNINNMDMDNIHNTININDFINRI